MTQQKPQPEAEVSDYDRNMPGDFTLPASGRKITISQRDLIGRDREQADIVRIQNGGSNFAWLHAIMSRVISFIEEGKGGTRILRQAVPEDLSEMSTRDIDAIMKALEGDERFFPPGGLGAVKPPLPPSF